MIQLIREWKIRGKRNSKHQVAFGWWSNWLPIVSASLLKQKVNNLCAPHTEKKHWINLSLVIDLMFSLSFSLWSSNYLFSWKTEVKTSSVFRTSVTGWWLSIFAEHFFRQFFENFLHLLHIRFVQNSEFQNMHRIECHAILPCSRARSTVLQICHASHIGYGRLAPDRIKFFKRIDFVINQQLNLSQSSNDCN